MFTSYILELKSCEIIQFKNNLLGTIVIMTYIIIVRTDFKWKRMEFHTTIYFNHLSSICFSSIEWLICFLTCKTRQMDLNFSQIQVTSIEIRKIENKLWKTMINLSFAFFIYIREFCSLIALHMEYFAGLIIKF